MSMGTDCATRVRGLFRIFSKIPVELYRMPSERDFNVFMFELIDVLESLRGLQVAKNKRKRK
tara:strand:+ start:290 stop:475 length:186 start_codon:yes stop_codon:yes gene_type:complete